MSWVGDRAWTEDEVRCIADRVLELRAWITDTGLVQVWLAQGDAIQVYGTKFPRGL